MTLISALHDAIVTKIATNLTSYKQLPDPYEIESNNKLYLKKGFGVAIKEGEATDRNVGCLWSYKRMFEIPLVNQITTTDHNITSRETLAKSILEDQYTVMTQFQIASSLGGNAISAIGISDDGVNIIYIDDVPYYIIRITLDLEYIEDLTLL